MLCVKVRARNVHFIIYYYLLLFLLQGYLGACCPLLKEPTALVSDEDHRLWIGCKGGQVLMCISPPPATDVNSDDEESPKE
jgi:hypothetical protein